MRNCPGATGQDTFAFKCDLCGRFGHRRDRCWKDERHANRSPEGWKSILRSNEHGNEDEDAALVSFNLMSYSPTELVLVDAEESIEGFKILSTDDTRGPEFNLAGFLPDASDDSVEGPSEIDSSNDTIVPAAAYAPPEVYRAPTAETAVDISFDSDDDDTSFEYARTTDSSNSEDMDEDSFYTDVGDKIVMLMSPGQSAAASIDLTGSIATIDLTHSTDEDNGIKHKSTPEKPLFTDTSADEPKDTEDPKLPVARELHIPMIDDHESEDEWEWDINREQAFNALGLPDVCIFTGSCMDYGQNPLTPDAAQRAANHLNLEEEIARHERELMLKV